MAIIRRVASLCLIAFGVFLFVYGGYDDSPGGQLLGLLILVLGLGAIRTGAPSARHVLVRGWRSAAYRAAFGLGVLGVLLLVSVNGAVGIIGSEDNPANGMYFIVLIAGLCGCALSHLEPRGMMWTLFAVAVMQMLVPIAALLFWETNAVAAGEPFWGGAGVPGVFALNAVYAALWTGSGLLFRRSSVDTGS